MSRRRTKLVDVRLPVDDKGRARIAACGDWHLGAKHCMEDQLDAFLAMCMEKRIHLLCMGDQLEMAHKTSVGAGVFEQDDPDSQINRVLDKLRPFQEAGLLIGVHSGNHEDRLFKIAGVNITALICQTLGCRYLNHAAFHRILVGKQSYTMFTTHGSSGARLPWTKIKAAMDQFRFVDSDIILYGHTHGLDHTTQLFRMVDKRNKKVEHRVRHACLTGSWLGYGGYAEQKNLPPVPIGSPIVNLYAGQHEIRVTL